VVFNLTVKTNGRAANRQLSVLEQCPPDALPLVRRVDGDVVDHEPLLTDLRTIRPAISPSRSATVTRKSRTTSA
jgi:hypothetical protein